ncbi:MULTISPECIES: NAD/NADP-dependent octopine/nopaline dehydrogenase family protein [Rhizobium/Agrobacterium group]|uniref:NAD/NADP octopine/nopaline dehydrogenase family protein n=1 Tax=Rhizobium/Agrobacterium group TaxID=227290 RepID=UPI001ADA7CDB|nr:MULTISPECIES: NAD/NADP-dependent octopine/nopaline dehydrogenase family protein [Rhizobium/Agrobacterium group]MBO9112482.1 NAD/NADP octopine/nopaline dehydrogenase family protein [Agrobacterium sp. S2/73]QXZ75990.1 NAD/NADP octopine/nopaline dehydrogenase family protein [Agrobacterium sp. S7/73]QYA16999.1 NAD/NADP octopine/nopaline dehydrogenase family protein [Rhizobium sp. AB2/73]UEQ85428.1 NAD/NADP octopine/nopaline dehydrogenase family protein [Rhizobium sp. AB2/73]
MASELTVGVIGGGHAGTALAAWFSSQKVQTAMWAPANHPGSLPSIRQHGGILASGLIEGKHEVTIYQELSDLLASAKFLILATRADVHQAFVQDLEKFVLKKPLLVICGHGFTVNYAARLMCERILETDDSPVTAKLIGGQGNEVHIKAILPSFGVSCYPVTRDGGGNLKLPKSISETLAKIFGSSITAISPLHSLFFSNYIIHAVSATLNIGRLRDPEGSLTERAEGWRTELESRVGADYRFYFYGQGTNSYVCAVIDAADKERLKVAGALGIKLDTVLAECNTQSKTDYVNMREFSLAPFPYNVNFACPDTLQHRYFSEEIRTMEMICAIAKSHRIKIPVTKSIMSLIKAARGDDVDALSLMGGLPFDPTKLSIFGARTV